MGVTIKETVDSFAPYTDITNIQFIATERKPNEITAQISRSTPDDERIDLGTPDQAVGKLRWSYCKNAALGGAGFGIGVITSIDGLLKILANGLDITGGCEIVTGTATAGYSLLKTLRRIVDLHEVRKSVGRTVNKVVSSSLDHTGNSLGTPES